MNAAQIIGIVNRLNAAPKSMKPQVWAELEAALREQSDDKQKAPPISAVATLRDMLTWPEVKDNPLAVARIARSLRKMREG